MVNLNGVSTRLDYEYYIERQAKLWEKMLEDYRNYQYNRELCDCYRQLQNIEPLITNINQNNINQIIDGINNHQTLNKIIDIILDKYDFSDHINHYNQDYSTSMFNYSIIDKTSTNFKTRLLYFRNNFDILEENIDYDINDYHYYANHSNFWTWFYWTILDQVRYAWRSIGNLSDLTLRKCLQKLNDFKTFNISGKATPSENYLRDIKYAVRDTKLIRDNYLVHLNSQNSTHERKVQLIKDIKEKYHEIYRLLRLNNPMHEN